MKVLLSIIKKSYRWILAIFLIGMVIFQVWRFVVTRGYESAVGTYITTGGQSYLVIKKKFFRRLDIEEGFFILNEKHLASRKSPKIFAQYRHNRLFIYQKEHGFAPGFLPPPLSSFGIYAIKEEYRSVMILEQSRTIPGDWELIDLKISLKKGGAKSFLHPAFWWYLLSTKSFKAIKYFISKSIRSRETLYCELDPAKAPIRSFLHLVNDPKMTEYFRARLNENPSEKTLKMIRELSSRYPTDLWISLHEVEQEALHGDAEKAETLFKKWKTENKSCPDTLLLKNAQHVSWIYFRENGGKTFALYPDYIFWAVLSGWIIFVFAH